MYYKLPEKFSSKWLLVYLGSLLISGAIILTAVGFAGIMMGQDVFKVNIWILYFFVAFANLIVCLFGFFNGKYIFLLLGLSVLVGTFTSGLLVAEDHGGWEYFAGIMSLLLYIGIGLIVGVVVELGIRYKEKKQVTNKKKIKLKKKTTLLLLLYFIILLMPLLISFFDL